MSLDGPREDSRFPLGMPRKGRSQSKDWPSHHTPFLPRLAQLPLLSGLPPCPGAAVLRVRPGYIPSLPDSGPQCPGCLGSGQCPQESQSGGPCLTSAGEPHASPLLHSSEFLNHGVCGPKTLWCPGVPGPRKRYLPVHEVGGAPGEPRCACWGLQGSCGQSWGLQDPEVQGLAATGDGPGPVFRTQGPQVRRLQD